MFARTVTLSWRREVVQREGGRGRPERPLAVGTKRRMHAEGGGPFLDVLRPTAAARVQPAKKIAIDVTITADIADTLRVSDCCSKTAA